MSLLSALKQKRESRRLATAISATQAGHGAGTVARIATIAVANATEPESAATSRAWPLHFADRDMLEVHCNPAATHTAMLKHYPDALAAEPIPERIRRKPTDAEAKELRALVQAVGKHEGWDAAEVEQATVLALADPDGAPICYREIAADLGVILWLDDDRRTCDQCANLAARRCLAAWRGEIVANRDYEPVRDIPRRCEGYAAGPEENDQRPGCERWPELIQKKGE